MHNQRAYFHEETLNNSLSADSNLNGNNKRYIIPYEQSENNLIKLKKSKPQYVEIDKLQFLIQNEYDNYNDR